MQQTAHHHDVIEVLRVFQTGGRNHLQPAAGQNGPAVMTEDFPFATDLSAEITFIRRQAQDVDEI
jgi:hypothetical protein